MDDIDETLVHFFSHICAFVRISVSMKMLSS